MENEAQFPVLITGISGFIGSSVARALMDAGKEVWGVDEFESTDKFVNWKNLPFARRIHRDEMVQVLQREKPNFSVVLHLGARTDTRERNPLVFEELILKPSRFLWEYCTENQIPLVYASSAATYGNGEQGYSDEHTQVEHLDPLNAYAAAKHQFDRLALSSVKTPPVWYGLKFFNVYGPGESHKKGMASVLFHGYNQIVSTGGIRLFESARESVSHGEQKRDFVWIGDVVSVIQWIVASGAPSGLYNLGSGVARSFNDLAFALFGALGVSPVIEYIPMPADLVANYQYYTCAEMGKLRAAGYTAPFTDLERGAERYLAYLSGK